FPEIHDREPRALRIYVVATDWARAGDLGRELQNAGFVPFLVANEAQLPAGAPWIDHVESAQHEDDTCGDAPTNYVAAFTLGVLPVYGCESFGARFELHRVPGAVAQPIDTRWEVPVLYGWFVWPMAALPGWRARVYFIPPGLAGD